MIQKILFLFLLVHGFNSISAQLSPEKIRSKRYGLGKMNDSAWSFANFWSRHYFMGEEKMSIRNYGDGMAAGDDEVAALVKKYRAQLTVGYVSYATGLTVFTIGMLQGLDNIFSANSHKGEVTALAGAIVMLGGSIIVIMGGSNFRKAEKLFNYKARRKELQPRKAELNFGVQRNGVGLALVW